MKKYCLTLDLKNNPDLIREYEEHHKNVWPEIEMSIIDSGIQKMEIFRWDTRLCMFIETSDDFSFKRKTKMDEANPIVQEWEELMWKYQSGLKGVDPDTKWCLMDPIFSLSKHKTER